MARDYFHLRRGSGHGVSISPEQLRAHTRNLFLVLWRDGYFQEAFGAPCVDAHDDARFRAASHFQVEALLPVESPDWMDFDSLSDQQVLGLHEAVFDIVSSPIEDAAANYHSYSDCGWHYANFDRTAGRAEYRDKANRYLALFEQGYEIDEGGSVQLKMTEPGSFLLDSALPPETPASVRETVDRAIRLYRKGTSTWDEREAAVRDLANALEPLRAKAKDRLGGQDEKDLFRILNEFSIRHLNRKQRGDYERRIFLTWLFYELLAAIHACERLAERSEA